VRGDLPAHTFGVLTDFALTHGCRLLCAPYTAQVPGLEKKRVWMEGHPWFELTTPGLRASHLVLKRALDLAVASLAAILFSPVLLLTAVWIKLDSPGPVLFRQGRHGMRGCPFAMLKLRSMHTDAEEMLVQDTDLHDRFLANGCKLPPDEDPRITRVGRFMRKTSLDELPQLFNVIRGDMSLVGPRPVVGLELENYGARVAAILSVKPGMTGVWQVSGRSAILFPERAEMDLDYVRNWSLLGDLWILLLTPAAVLMRRGAH
jgi:exopolysaccharide production protein ExoY